MVTFQKEQMKECKGFLVCMEWLFKSSYCKTGRVIGNMGSLKKHKKIFLISGTGIVIAAILVMVYFVPYLRRHYKTVLVNVSDASAMEKVDIGDKNVLTVYFTRVGNSDFEEDVDAVSSASLMEENGELIGNSQLLATMVQNAVGGDVYPIHTEKKYPSGYADTTNVAKMELDSNEEVRISGELPDMKEYDTVVLVFPLWWGTIPNAVKTFLQSEDMSDKALHLIVTHGGSGKGNSVEDIKRMTDAKVSDNVLTIYDDVVTEASDTVGEWLRTL